MTPKNIELGYVKRPLIDLYHLEKTDPTQLSLEDQEKHYRPLNIVNLQQYQPIYSLFFDMTENNYNSIQLNNRRQVVNMTTTFDTETNLNTTNDIFIKYSPLFDPIKYMIGKYGTNTSNPDLLLPTFTGIHAHDTTTHENNSISRKKMDSVYNASYVDGFFCYLSSKLLNNHGFKHGMDYYGSYLGIQKQFKMNIVDDYSYLLNSTFFNLHLNKLFKTTHQDFIHSLLNKNSRANRHKLFIQDSTENLDILSANDPLDLNIEELDAPTQTHHENSGDVLENIYQQTEPVYDTHADNSDSENNYSSEEDTASNSDDFSTSLQSSNVGEHDSDEDEDEDEDEEEDDEPENIYAYINDFPVQMIFLEKCDGTLDELFESGLDDKHAASALFQVIMTLIAYQRAFRFTHNDLHTNNIMFKKTEQEFLYYKYQNVTYKVPTYGKIFKIIDFGRSIYHFHGHRFCSDSFSPGGDAATQYNCEPYFNENKPRIEPNDSFDLCRLGTSIFDFVFDIDDPDHTKKMTPLQATIMRWCTDDAGKNVLYKRNGEERYPNFKLYKMIARNVHEHTPQAQLNFPLFKQFRFKGKPHKILMNIDLIPTA